MSRRVLVAGLGNVLMSDDAIGPYCIAYLLANYEFPPEVEVVDLGAPGLDLLLHIASADVVIAVDAIRDVEPGTLHAFDRASLGNGSHGPRLDTHAPALDDAIAFVELVRGVQLDVVLIGVGGASFEHGTGLSCDAHRQLGALAERVLRELAVRGVGWRDRERPGAADAWWERPSVPTSIFSDRRPLRDPPGS